MNIKTVNFVKHIVMFSHHNGKKKGETIPVTGHGGP
jgi:hypothetical protein